MEAGQAGRGRYSPFVMGMVLCPPLFMLMLWNQNEKRSPGHPGCNSEERSSKGRGSAGGKTDDGRSAVVEMQGMRRTVADGSCHLPGMLRQTAVRRCLPCFDCQKCMQVEACMPAFRGSMNPVIGKRGIRQPPEAPFLCSREVLYTPSKVCPSCHPACNPVQ